MGYLCALVGIVLVCSTISPAHAVEGIPSDWDQVYSTNYHRLWRFHVGFEDGRPVAVKDSDKIALWTSQGMFISVTSDGHVKLQTSALGESEGIKVIHHDWEYKTLLQSRYGKYFVGGDWWAGYKVNADRTAASDWEKFGLFISPDDTKLAIFTPAHQKWWRASGSEIITDAFPAGDNGIFLGWKKGTKEDWTPRQSWQLIASFDNSGSNGEALMSYTKTTGTSNTNSNEYCVSASITAGVGGTVKAATVSVEATLGFSWTTTNSETWEQSTSVQASITVPAGSRTSLYQAQAKFGPYVVRAFHFKAVNW